MCGRSLLILTAAALWSGGAAAQVTALTHATLVDGSGAPPQANVTILMENGRIRDLGPSIAVPAGATVIDLTGKFVVPGIINAHGHVGPPPPDGHPRQYAPTAIPPPTTTPRH